MRKLVYSMLVSLDGHVTAPDGAIDWHIPDEELHTFANQQARGTGAFLYGRRLYENMAAFWPTADEDPSAPPVVVEFARIWRDTPKADLIDEFQLLVHPVVVGGGTAFFPPLDERVDLRLEETRRFGSGVVYLRYQRA